MTRVPRLVDIEKLPDDRWKDYRDLRLEALKNAPSAFGSSFEEEEVLTEDEWKRRIQNVLFAVSEDTLIGMIVYAFNGRAKTRHSAEIFGVYVSAGHRGEGVGTRMLEHALIARSERTGGSSRSSCRSTPSSASLSSCTRRQVSSLPEERGRR